MKATEISNRALKLFFIVVLLTLLLNATWSVGAQSGSFILELEQNWDTFGIGGTCVYGGYNFAVEDLDGDGLKEIITGGGSYNYFPNGTRTQGWAPLKIWNWNGEDFLLECNHSWTGSLRCIYAGDADGDGKAELITSGYVRNDSDVFPSLRIWTWTGENLLLRGSYDGVTVGAISIGDADGDGQAEIITVTGPSFGYEQSASQISLFRWNGFNLTLIRSFDCFIGEKGRVNSVSSYDFDDDGLSEIVTAGYTNNLNNSHGQIRIWRLDGTTLSCRGNADWCMIDGAYSLDTASNILGNTLVNKIQIDDVDDDGVDEIVTVGFTYDGAKLLGQIRIWNWTEEVLNLEKSQEWENLDISEPKSLSIEDLDNDGKKEIVTSGYTAGYNSFPENAENKSRGEFKIWNWDGSTLVMKGSMDWLAGASTAAHNVETGDVDNDGTVEILTVGCIEVGNFRDCDPNLRIWSMAKNEDSTFSPLLIVLGAMVVIILVAAIFLVRKRKKPL
jgi:hypothetical protein